MNIDERIEQLLIHMSTDLIFQTHLKKYRDIIEHIHQLSENEEHIIIAIDGKSASGKTTFAKTLGIVFDANVIHMDDFYLPKDHQKPEQNPSHMNIESVKEVLKQISNKEQISYQKFDCKVQELTEHIKIKNKKITIVEGAYSMHPELESFYSLKIFAHVSKTKQVMRIIKRNGFKRMIKFMTSWIPRENRYFKKYKITKSADYKVKCNSLDKDIRNRHLVLHDHNIYKGLLIIAIPLMINNFIKTIHDVIDMFFVGSIPQYGTDAIAAIQLTFPVVFTFVSLGIGLSVAGTALISQNVGSGQYKEARKYASQLVVLSLITGIILNVISYFGAPLIMRLMGADGYILENSVKYLQIRSFELPVVFVFFAFTAIRQSSGDTITPVIYGIVTVILNIILTPIFVWYFNLGVPGAAYATLIANIVIMPMGLIQLFKARTGIIIERQYLKLEREVSYNIIRTAIPAAFGQAFTAIGFGIMNGIIYSYGSQTVAAFAVGNRLSSIVLQPVMALGGVLATFMGQNIGNQNVDRAKESFSKAMKLSIILMVIGSAVFINFRSLFAGFFIKDDPYALSLTNEYMFYLFIGLPLMAIFQTYMGAFNGTGNTKYTFIISITRLWLMRIPLVFAIKYFTDLGSAGVWYAMLASNILISFVGYFLYRRVDFNPKVRIYRSPRRMMKENHT